MGIIKSSIREVLNEFEWGKKEYPTIFPFNNDMIKQKCVQYQLSAEEITKLYDYFCVTDTNNIGYVFFKDLCTFIEVIEDSITIPY